MKIIGLTGGIGSGKSTVSSYLLKKGYAISDADKIAHDIMEPGMPALRKMVDAFGDDILDADGTLRRKYVGSIVFADKEKKVILDNITHGEISKVMKEDIKRNKKAGCKLMFVDAPLLFEAGLEKWCDVTWVVTAELETRINRVVLRDGLAKEDVEARIANQMSDDEKVALADEVIDNSHGVDELYSQIEELLRKYENKY